MISNIAYLRALLDEELFIDKKFDGLHLKILKPITKSNSSKDAQILNGWLNGAFEALDLKYVNKT
jgi:hypothetical protein